MQSCHLVTTEGIQLCKELEYVDFQVNLLTEICLVLQVPSEYLFIYLKLVQILLLTSNEE